MNRKKFTIFLILAGLFILPLGQKAQSADKFDLTKYHDYKEVTKILKELQNKHSGLARLNSEGKSLLGKDLWVMEISNKKTGNPDEKPAIFFGAGIRGDEIVGTEVCLYTIKHLLENYASDKRVKKMLDERTLYFFPTINPDGCDFTVKNPGKPMRKNFRKTDEDHDGKIDEDPAEDLNKDGFITMMRVPDKKGDFQICKLDSRVMVPANKKNKIMNLYKLYVEGIDNDKDEKYNEDGVGGVDLNFNFPAGWKIDSYQAGSGMYPASEPESETVVRFLTDHPNLAMVLVYQSGKGALFRPYNFLEDKKVPKVDLKIYELFGKKYEKIVGKKMTHGYPEPEKKEKKTRSVKAKSSDGDATDVSYNIASVNNVGSKQNPMQQARPAGERTRQVQAKKNESIEFGTFLDWAYKDYTVYSLSPNLWTVPDEYRAGVDSAKKTIEDDLSWFAFQKKELGGKGFVPWQKYKHPQLGEVEIGGWCDFYKKNPPVGKRLEDICIQQVNFTIDAAEIMPAVRIKEVEIKPLQALSSATESQASTGNDGTISISRGSKKISGKAMIAEIKIKVENIGQVGTSTAQAQKTRFAHQPPRSVLAYLEAKDDNIEILSMPKVLRLGAIEGTKTKDLVSETQPEEEGAERRQRQEQRRPRRQREEKNEDELNIKSGTWLVCIEGDSAELTVKVVAEKGGTVLKKVQVTF